MLIFQSVSKIYSPDIKALEDVSFELQEKEFLVLAGKSGAGKTTLLKLVLANEEPTNGKVLWDGEDIHSIRRQDVPYLRRKIGVVFQDYKLLSSKTIYENIAFIMEAIGADDEEIQSNVPRALELVGLKDKFDRFPRELSSGEKQKAAIARALIHRPTIILADEPTGNLDPYNTSDIIKLLLKINELGTTVVLATHNKEVIKGIKKRTILLKEGRLARDDEKGGILF